MGADQVLCKDCKHLKSYPEDAPDVVTGGDDYKGTCQYNPPTAGGFPYVRHDGWCKEGQQDDA